MYSFVFGGRKISGRKIKQFILYMHPEIQPFGFGFKTFPHISTFLIENVTSLPSFSIL
jgi:hypothetical protein